MKLLTVLFSICLIVNSALAYPTTGESHPDNDAEVLVDKHHGYQPEAPAIPNIPTAGTPVFHNYGGTVDTGYGVYHPGFFNYIPINPYSWNWSVFSRFSALLQQLREQAVSTWSHVPSIRPSFSLWPGELEKNGNTTSTVKVVDGHKVVINDTVYTKHTEFGDTVYKVRVIDVEPLDESTETNVETVTNQPEVFVHNDGSVTVTEREFPTTVVTNAGHPSNQPESRETFDDNTNRDVDADVGTVNTGSPEELDSSNDNEISKDIDEQYEEIESTDITTEMQHNKKRENSNELERFESLTSSEWNQINKQHASNEALETFDKTFNVDVNTQRNDNGNGNDNENNIEFNGNGNERGALDEFDNKVPIDLSNDIAVNQMLADQGAPFNPDAEVFDVNEFNKNNNNNNRQQWAPERYQSLQQEQHQQQPHHQYHPYQHQHQQQQQQQWQQFHQRPQPIVGQPFEYLPFYPISNTNNKQNIIKK